MDKYLVSLALVVFATVAASAMGQNAYPSRPITLVVPFPAGGVLDIVARALAKEMTSPAAQPVIVEKRGGAAGTIGTASVATANPDRDTLLFGSLATRALGPALYPKIQYDALKDFARITQVTSAPLVFANSAMIPATALAQLIALAKNKAGTLNYASTGIGTADPLAGALFASATGIDALHVPNNGGAEAKTALIAGAASNSITNVQLALPQIQAGKLGALAVTGPRRPAVLTDTPTLRYYLSTLGYHTSLAGKMHFVGPDQMHGFDQRLTTDIYPSDFGWTPNWLINPPHGSAGMSVCSVVEAGLCTRSLQFDYDDEVAYKTIQKIHDLSRRPVKQPFFLTASFTHPHNPYVTTQQWWDKYAHGDIDMPKVPPIPYSERDPHSRRLHWLFRQDEHRISDEQVRTARHAYYANISYVDDQIGRILATLHDTGLDQNTRAVFTSDHGEMLGERGIWHKYSLLEPALKVPLIFRVPGLASKRVSQLVSHVDLLPTVHELASGEPQFDAINALDGASIAPLLHGHARNSDAAVFAAEFTGQGAIAPMVTVRTGAHKLIASLVDRESWDFQPFTDASKQFVRSGGQSSPTLVKGLARFPVVSPQPPDTPREST